MKLVNISDIDPLEPGRFVIGERYRGGVSVGWYLRETIPISKRKNRRNPYVFTALKAHSRKEASLQVLIARAGTGLGKAPGAKQPRMKIRALANAWVEALDKAKAHRNRRFRTSLQNHILPYFGDSYIAELERSAIHDWAEKRVQKGVKESTFKIDVHALRTFLNWCDRKYDTRVLEMMPTDWGHLSFKPASISSKFPKDIADQLISFSFAEAIRHSNPSHPCYWSSARLYGVIAFLRFTGIRVQEFGQLRFQDIIIRRATAEQKLGFVHRNMLPPQASKKMIAAAVSSEEAAYWAGFSVHVRGVKHKSHERIVTPRVEFFNDWIEYLDFYRERCLGLTVKIRMTGSIDGIPSENAIFPNTPYDLKAGGRSLSRPHATLLSRFAESNKIEFRNLNQQCWRHTYATELIEDWINSGASPDVQMLARNMGTSEAMLRRHYEKELDVIVPLSLSV